MRKSSRHPKSAARVLAGLGVALGALALLLLAWLELRPPTRPPAPVPEAAPARDTRRAVYHADFADPRRLGAMLTSVGNLIGGYQKDQQDYDVRIVFVSHGIRFLTDDPLKGTPYAEDRALRERRADLRARLLALHDDQGVKLELCNLTRETINLEESRLYPGVELVPSGESRLVELEGNGYAYLKTE